MKYKSKGKDGKVYTRDALVTYCVMVNAMLDRDNVGNGWMPRTAMRGISPDDIAVLMGLELVD